MTAKGIAIGFISPGQVFNDFAMGLSSTIMLDNGRHKIRQIIGIESSPRVAEGRSQVVEGFLAYHEKLEWLLMIDADMGWRYEDFEALCKVADVDNVPIVGALCFGGGRTTGIFPTIYEIKPDEEHGWDLERKMDYPKNALIKCGGTGAAFLLVHRKVYLHMAKANGKMPDGTPNPYPWFAESTPHGRPMGEDLTFCLRAQALGYPVHVFTGAKTTHMKSHRLSEELYEQLGHNAGGNRDEDRPSARSVDIADDTDREGTEQTGSIGASESVGGAVR